MLTSYASRPEESMGRKFNEIEEKSDIFLRDREKVIHSVAFRRLEYKTQVFVNHMGDHYRTRLTHTIEVAHVASYVCRKMRLNEDLGATIALCHDLGHPPFGHAGEEALDKAAKKYGGFDHNAQTLKVLLELEQRYIDFPGLNLSIEALEGIAKHNGPISEDYSTHHNLIGLCHEHGIDLEKYPSLEAQVASLADDIAYISHDIDDGIRAGFFDLHDIGDLPIISQIYKYLTTKSDDATKITNDLVRQLSYVMMNDLVTQSNKNIVAHGIKTVQNVRDCGIQLIDFSDEFRAAKDVLKGFLFKTVYRHYTVNRMTEKANHLLTSLFEVFMKSPECLPTNWFEKVKASGDKASTILDYISGMTDRYAMEEYGKLFNPELF